MNIYISDRLKWIGRDLRIEKLPTVWWVAI